MADKCLSFFRSLRNVVDFIWTEECQAAFKELKKYLGSSQLLTKSNAKNILYLYLRVSASMVSAIIVKEEKGNHKPIYYTRKVL